jgi:hypothetical protein|uniref:Uncharacterized protein n=1 Tax=Myoviridae sp. ctXVO17 TaxID=2825121 RepID=A0A8S5P2Z7_9CAUD|nr:MAG TPA: hypothetical protein [Myoviridae sp. ctXVO17]
MALKKKITEKNGIVTDYHRIAMLSVEVNQQCTILVHSYLTEDARIGEKQYRDGVVSELPPHYVKGEYYNTDYDEDMNVKKAYEYIKSLPQFEGAEDA